jgi:hypothetical protein
MIILKICFDAIDDGSGPLNDDVFQTILLIEVGIHILSHGLSGLL